ncbi:MAG: Na+/H+ antiporter subunit E [Lachnospiraceae bacterium]|nr:Na+/H+ antiporter subunit E [Lachnospiraceae bacterium]
MYLVLVVLWIIFNGQFTVEILLFGLGISAVVYWFMCKFLDFSVAKDLLMLKELILFLWYAENLIVEILKANVQTFRILMSNQFEPEPVIVKFRTDLETTTARVLLANSITLTPGTITVSLEDNEYLVHCLDKELAEGIEDSSFVKILHKMEELRARSRK